LVDQANLYRFRLTYAELIRDIAYAYRLITRMKPFSGFHLRVRRIVEKACAKGGIDC
jgi:hypothetical protein